MLADLGGSGAPLQERVWYWNNSRGVGYAEWTIRSFTVSSLNVSDEQQCVEKMSFSTLAGWLSVVVPGEQHSGLPKSSTDYVENGKQGWKGPEKRLRFSWAASALQLIQLSTWVEVSFHPFYGYFLHIIESHQLVSGRTASRLDKCNVAFYSFAWLPLPRSTSLLKNAKGKMNVSTDDLLGI